MMDVEEVKDEIAHILMYLDEKTHTSEKIATMADLNLFNLEETETLFPMGLNNKYDSALGGCAPQELVLFGGYRGSGKSVVSNNLMVNQYLMGNSCVYFSIEMRAQEVFSRTMSILADVNNTNLVRGLSSERDLLSLAQHRAEMFVDAGDLLEDFLQHKDFDKFEQQLNHNKVLKPTNQMVIIDDQRLTIPNIDLHLQNFKAQFGDRLKLVVVDYVNQIVADDMYNWQTQLTLSKELKNLARKHNVCVVAPYQIDATGEARYAKGILDAADRAFILKPQDHETGIFSFETTKMRNGTPMNFSSTINWKSLKISPVDIPFQDKIINGTTKRKAPKAKTLNKMSDDLSY
jgi:replicative DNA helicase